MKYAGHRQLLSGSLDNIPSSPGRMVARNRRLDEYRFWHRLPSASITWQNAPDDLSLLASGVAPARETGSAGGMTEVPQA
jgi:hypothetical protein